MKTLRLWTVLLAVFAIFSTAPIASAIGIEGAVGWWSQGPEGDISYQGDSLSLEDDLKYSKEWQISGRLKIDMPLFIPNIYLMATQMRFDGEGMKAAGFEFGGITFQSVSFDSELILDNYDVALYYGMPFLETATLGRLNAEAGINLRVIDFRATVTQDAILTTQSQTFTYIVPTVYLGAQFKPIELINFEGEIRGITYAASRFYELIGRIKVKPFGPAFIAGGYRYQDIKVDDNDVIADIKIGGPFFEAGLEF